MKKLNNKGQTLVLFVLLLPIMLFVMVLVFDIGKFLCEKQDLDQVSSMVVRYGVDHVEEEDIENELMTLLLLNCDDVSSISVSVDEDYVSVDLMKKSSSIFGNVFDIDFLDIRSSYVGYVLDHKIERIK